MDPERGAGARRALAAAGVLTALACAAALAKGWPLAWPLVAGFRIAWSLLLLAYAVAPVLALGGVVGRRAFRDLWDAAPAWRIFLAGASGWALVAGACTAMLAAGAYSETAWAAVAALVNAVVAARAVVRRKALAGALSARFRNWFADAGRSWTVAAWSWVLLGILVTALLAAVAPPIARDEVTYHLVVPRMWQFQGSWALPTDNLHWLFPAAAETVWGYGLGVGGLVLPRLLTLAFGLMTVAMARRWLVDEGFDPWTVRTSLVFLVAAPLTFVSLAMCNVEWPLAFALLLGWWASRRFLEGQGAGGARLAGLAWGLALGTKYTAVPAVGLLVVESLARLALRRRFRAALALAAWVSVGAALFALPWLVRNLVLTGDPFYPLGAVLTSSAAGGPQAAALLDYAHLTGAWRLFPWLYHATADTVLDHRLHLGWPLLLAAVVLLGWRLRASRPWPAAAGTALALLAFSPAPRAYFATLLLAWLFLPDFLSRCADSRAARAAASAILALLVVTSAPASYLSTLGSSQPVQEYLLGITGRDEALRRAGFLTPAVSWVRAEVPANDRLWVWGDEQTLYFDRWTRAGSYLDRPGFLAEFERLGPDGFSRLLREQGIRVVVVNRKSCPPPFDRVESDGGRWALRPEFAEAWRRWVGASLREAASDEELTVFRVLP